MVPVVPESVRCDIGDREDGGGLRMARSTKDVAAPIPSWKLYLAEVPIT